MCPIYAVLAAPLVRPLRVPLVLWFTHWRRSRLLELAERASTAVTSVDERSFPFPSPKLRAIGHGIDLEEFPCSPPRAGDGMRLLALGRYSTAKGLDAVVAAVPLAGEDVTLDVHGPALSTEEEAHRAELEQVVAELDLDGRVTIGGPFPRAEIPQLFATHDALVNNMRAGAPDKVVYEAAASCLPVLASNPIFDDLLDADQRFTRWDPGALAERVRALAALSPEARGTLGRRLRERVADRPFGAVMGPWHPRRGGDLVKDGVVLHTQKVAGISGSEAHLLQLLPDLRERGWDGALPHAPRGRAGRLGVRARAPGARSAAARRPPAGGRRPGRLRRGGGVPRAPPAADPAHAPRPCGRLRPARRRALPRAAPALDEARVQRVP